MIGLINPRKPDYVAFEVREQLKPKEKDYLYIMGLEKRPCREDVKRMLYISTDRGLAQLRNRVMSKLHQKICE